MAIQRGEFVDYIESRSAGEEWLRVRFSRESDRYAHVVECLRGGTVQASLRSLEGSNEDWPPSPPLQHLHIEERDGGASGKSSPRRVALLVGMAGRSHWSLSVEPLPARCGFEFDVACRTNDSPAILLSTYVCEGNWQNDSGHERIILLGEFSAILEADRAQKTTLHYEHSRVRLEPASSGDRTYRWKYRIELS